jgi:hypothetical protein
VIISTMGVLPLWPPGLKNSRTFAKPAQQALLKCKPSVRSISHRFWGAIGGTSIAEFNPNRSMNSISNYSTLRLWFLVSLWLVFWYSLNFPSHPVCLTSYVPSICGSVAQIMCCVCCSTYVFHVMSVCRS